MLKKSRILFMMLFAASLLAGGNFLYAQSADLQSKIDTRNAQIKQLEEEINQYNIEVANTQSEAKTLQNTIKTLDVTKKKITTDITLTGKKIDKANLTISQLGGEIVKTEDNIATNKQAIMKALEETDQLENIGIVQLVLSNKNLGELWNDIDTIQQIQQVIHDKSKELVGLKTDMETKQSSLKTQKATLQNLKQDLTGKQLAVESTVQEKATILAQTKNKEQAFQALIQSKAQQKAQFENEVANFEAQLHLTIDPDSYPAPQHGVLSWPLDNAPTQKTCDTAHKVVSCIVRGFIRAVMQNGVVTTAGHNGVDLRASIGTQVKSALDGVVAGTGNTDVYKGCYGLGKWVMINHPNGLSTIYMHLSVISVNKNQNVSAGDLIGLSGNTGNSEAPHLHVSVYATQGVRIEQFVNSIGCKQAVVPLADPRAYLDPLAYFPAI